MKARSKFFFRSIAALTLSAFLFVQGSRAAGTDNAANYDLGRGAVVETVLKFVAEQYIDPGRFDPEKAFENTMKDLEAFVPEFRCDFIKGSKRYRIQMNTQAKEVDQARLLTYDDYLRNTKIVLGFIQKALKSDIQLPKIEYETVNGFLETLDPHSRLMDPDNYEEFVVATQGEFGGLGVQIQMRDNQLTVISPVDDTPAARAGIRPGDRIIKIEDESTDNMTLDDAVKRLRGPANTQVKITILRGKLDPFDITLTRDKIRLKAVESALLDDSVGYVKIKSFQENTAVDMEQAMDQLQKQLGDKGPLKGTVLDLRNNPGGLLDEATALANRYIKQGVIVTTVDGRNTKPTRAKAGFAKKYGELPLIVLVNEGSASASEIVAGAIKNQNRGLIMGQRTFGKGSVQNVFPLSDKSALKLTVQQYLTPGDISIQNIGVMPNIQLNPVVVAPEEIRLRAHQRPYREVDLDNHLLAPGANDQIPPNAEKPQVELDYLLEPDPKGEDEVGNEDPSKPFSSTEKMKSDLAKDFPVQLARQIIVEGGTSQLPAFLDNARATIRKSAKSQASAIDKALTKAGLDWSTGPGTKTGVSLDVALTVQDEKGAVIPAAISGKKNYLDLKVTNRSQSMLYRLHAYTVAENGYFNNQEFLFGRIAPGATAEKKIPVTLGHGLSGWTEYVKVAFESGDNEKIYEIDLPVSIARAPGPRFDLTYTLSDNPQTSPLIKGDGDGLIEAGETAGITFKVKNTGKGDSERVFIQLRSKSAQLVEVGTTGTRYMIKGLKAGATDTVLIPVRVSKDFIEPKVTLPLRISDANFPVEISSDIDLPVSQGPAAHARDPIVTGKPVTMSAPAIQVDQNVNAGLTVNDRMFKMSGEVVDDGAVKDLFIMVNGRKASYQSFEQAGLAKLDKYPFNVRVPIKTGLNRVIIVARDSANLTSAQSFTVWQTDGPLPGSTAQRESPTTRPTP